MVVQVLEIVDFQDETIIREIFTDVDSQNGYFGA